jgi:ornithine cyclodeaminase/alanine dehydrogenase-like protein (mu-crystallin family)
MKLRILTEGEIRQLLTMADAIDIQARAFQMLARGLSVDGLRSQAVLKTPPSIVIFNPSVLKDGSGWGIKIAADYYQNETTGIVPRMSAVIYLADGKTGHPRTLLEGGHITDLRTGAGLALAARYLARKDSRVVTIIGAGRVARFALEALSEVCSLEKVLLATRSEGRGRQFINQMSKHGGKVPRDIELVADRDKAVRAADVVVAATTSKEPVFKGAELKPGTFVIAAGGYEPHHREVDSETIRRASKWVIDSRRDCLDHAGDLVIPIAEKIIREDQVADIADVVDGRRPGRESNSEITYFKSVGVPIQDLITAQEVERRAIERGIGTLVDLGGDHD